jgi:hypothetical protein
VALFRRNQEAAEPAPTPTPTPVQGPGTKKDRPTPSRKEAEAARRQRFTQTLSKKESRAMAGREARAQRMKVTNLREGAPEKVLMRDYIDARRNLGELLLPSVVVILAVTVLGQYLPLISQLATAVMYLFILAVLLDGFIMWRGFKVVLAARLPKASPKGLLMYGMTRGTQIRRFRMPAPRIKRGEAY